MNIEWLASLPPLLGLGIIAWGMRKTVQSWYAPAAFFPILWSVAIGLPLFFAPDYRIWAPGTWFLFLFIIIFSGFALLGQRGRVISWSSMTYAVDSSLRPVSGVTSFGTVRLDRVEWAILLSCALGLTAIWTLLGVASKSWADLLNLGTWIEMGARFSVARYQEGFIEPLGARIGTVGFYLGALLGGMLAASCSGLRSRSVALAPVLLSLVYASMMTTRATLLFSFSMWISTYIVTKVFFGHRLKAMFSIKLIFLFSFIGLTVFVIFLLLQMSRAGYEDFLKLEDTIDHLEVWFFGHLSGFSLWLENHFLRFHDLTLGQRTFGGLFQLFGMEARDQRAYLDRVLLTADHETNIYTAFRGLIEDFGYSGSIICIAAFGFLSGAFYDWVRRGRRYAIPLLAASYVCMIWSPIVNFFSFNTLILAFIVFAAMLPIVIGQNKCKSI